MTIPSRQTPTKTLRTLTLTALVALVGLGLVACSGSDSAPSSSGPEASGPETESPSESDLSLPSSSDSDASAPSTSAEDSASSGDVLPVERAKLIGHWRTTGRPEGEPNYVYAFRADGTFQVLNAADESVVLQGDYELTVDRRVRLIARDPDSGDAGREMTLALTVRRGEGHYVFEVTPGGQTLWLQRVERAGDDDETSSE